MFLGPLLFGTVLILPPPGHSATTLGPNGATFTFRDPSGTSTILRPGQLPIFDFDTGGGNHTTLVPGQLPIFTFGDGTDEDGE